MRRAIALTVVFLCTLAYASGIRLISLAEVPSSHRPWQVFLSADYASQHLSPVASLFGE